jgi:cation diffusion facilitator CzcD-associated flavoprotein CzcO
VRCDIPSHSYQYTFENNNQWSEYYATGGEIQAYLQRTARKYGAYKYIKFNHTLKGATWKAEEGKWHVTLEDTTTGTVRIQELGIFTPADSDPDFCRHLRCLSECDGYPQQMGMADY